MAESTERSKMPWAETPDTYPVGIPVAFQVVFNRYDEDMDNHKITMNGPDGDQISFRVPPSMAKMFPLEMTIDATVNFEVPA